jgi:hypothetical protein
LASAAPEFDRHRARASLYQHQKMVEGTWPFLLVWRFSGPHLQLAAQKALLQKSYARRAVSEVENVHDDAGFVDCVENQKRPHRHFANPVPAVMKRKRIGIVLKLRARSVADRRVAMKKFQVLKIANAGSARLV